MGWWRRSGGESKGGEERRRRRMRVIYAPCCAAATLPMTVAATGVRAKNREPVKRGGPPRVAARRRYLHANSVRDAPFRPRREGLQAAILLALQQCPEPHLGPSWRSCASAASGPVSNVAGARRRRLSRRVRERMRLLALVVLASAGSSSSSVAATTVEIGVAPTCVCVAQQRHLDPWTEEGVVIRRMRPVSEDSFSICRCGSSSGDSMSRRSSSWHVAAAAALLTIVCRCCSSTMSRSRGTAD